MNKKIAFASAAGLLVIVLLIFLFQSKSDKDTELFIEPSVGTFVVAITTTGELQAKNSIDIRGPQNARLARIWNMKITDLVPEGTIVKSGEYVAQLDKSELTNNIQESQINLQKLESQLVQVQLDSSLALSAARNDIVNLEYNLEQRRLNHEQSKFEPPAIRRQAEIELEKAERSLTQARKNYDTKVRQAIEKIKVVDADLTKQQQRHQVYEEVLEEFTITAPENGMVIYAKEWGGKKKVVGATISTWDPVVATLPDLSVMESLTFINEVDIQKVAIDQEVEVTLDADPDKKLTGIVTSVANIGEQHPHSDSKVFEVKIQISEPDTTLRPSMTTGNNIVVATQDSSLFVPLVCIHSLDSLSIVYRETRRGTVMQEIERGLVNENYAIISRGVKASDKLLSNPPEDADDLDLIRLD